jgi:tetratricopeptide (TPR) repeat protein
MRILLSVLVGCTGALWVHSPLAVWSDYVWHLPMPWQRVVTGLQVMVTAAAVVWVAGASMATGWRRLRALTPAALAAGLLGSFVANRWLLQPGLIRCPDLLWMVAWEWLGRSVVLLVPSLAAAALPGSFWGRQSAASTDTGIAARRLRRSLLAACGIAAAVAALWWAATGVGRCQQFRWELRRGIALVSTLNCAEAVPVFERILAWCPRSHYTRVRLGWALLRSGRPREAAGEFQAVLAAQPRYPYARTGLGECLTQERRYAEARQELQAAIAEDPEDAEAHYGLGSAAGLEWWRMEGLDGESRQYHVGRTGHPALRHTDLLHESVRYLCRAVELAPGRSEYRTLLGSGLLWSGEAREAAAQFREAVRLAPQDLAAWTFLSDACLAVGDTEGARDALRRPLTQAPRDPYPHCLLAAVLERMGRWEEAIAELRTAARLGPAQLYAYLVWADTALRRSSPAGVNDTLRGLRELARQPTAAEGAHVAAGMLLLHSGKPAEAAAEFRGALHANPRSAEAHYGLGRAAQAQGDLSAAVTELRQALAFDVYIYAAHAALADVYWWQDDQTAWKAEAALAEGESPDLLASTRTPAPR